MVAETFRKGVKPYRCLPECDIRVARDVSAAETVDRCRDAARRLVDHRPFCHPVQNTAAAAPAKDHGVRPFVHLNPVDVVKAAIILNVVAQPVDKEVGS